MWPVFFLLAPAVAGWKWLYAQRWVRAVRDFCASCCWNLCCWQWQAEALASWSLSFYCKQGCVSFPATYPGFTPLRSTSESWHSQFCFLPELHSSLGSYLRGKCRDWIQSLVCMRTAPLRHPAAGAITFSMRWLWGKLLSALPC